MDFTSDSVRHSSVASEARNSRSSSRSSSSNDLSELDLRTLKLQEQRNSLLSRRNGLLQEIQSLKSRAHTTHEETDARLLDLVLLTSGKEKASAITIDGSDLEKELQAKYDTLPLLNMQLRLETLRKLYQYVDLSVSSSDDIVEAHARFYRSTEPFDLDLRLNYKGETLYECGVEVSRNVQWPLRSLLKCKNPSRILLGCFEYDRLRCGRDELFNHIQGEMGRFASLVTITRTESALTLHRFATPEAKLTIRYTIEFEEFLPSSRIQTSLQDGQIDISAVTSGLLKEYGLRLGLLQLCKACLCL